MRTLLALVLTLISLQSRAQFFDVNGKFISNVLTADDARIGWTMPDYSQELSGAVTLAGPYGNNKLELFCSGSLVSARNAKPTSPVYVVSNGHCSGFLDEFMRHPESNIKHENFPDATIALMKNFKNIKNEDKVRINLTEIVFATMYLKDISVLKTDKTVAEIQKMGFKIYNFAAQPADGGKLTAVGVPLAGRSPKYAFMHKSQCDTFGTTRLLEASINSIALRTNCSAVGGQSGSPMFNPAGEIAALTFTGYEKDAPGNDCAESKPCEINSKGVKKSYPNYSYAIPVHGLDACFNSNGVFEATAACGLQ